MKTSEWASDLIFLVLHLPARAVVEFLSLGVWTDMWMWLWRTWFSGDHGGAAGWWLHLVISKVFANLNDSMTWLVGSQTTCEDFWRNLSLQHSSPKEVFSHLIGSQPEQGQCEVNKSLPSRGVCAQHKAALCECDQPGFGAVKEGLKTKASGSSLREKQAFLKGARAMFLLEVVLGKPRGGGAEGAIGAWSCWLRNAENVTGMFSQNGDEGLSQELIPSGG